MAKRVIWVCTECGGYTSRKVKVCAHCGGRTLPYDLLTADLVGWEMEQGREQLELFPTNPEKVVDN